MIDPIKWFLRTFFLLLSFILFSTLAIASELNNKMQLGLTAKPYVNSYLFTDNHGPLELEGIFNYSLGILLKYVVEEKHVLVFETAYSSRHLTQKIDFADYRPINYDDPLLLNDKVEEKSVRDILNYYFIINTCFILIIANHFISRRVYQILSGFIKVSIHQIMLI